MGGGKKEAKWTSSIESRKSGMLPCGSKVDSKMAVGDWLEAVGGERE